MWHLDIPKVRQYDHGKVEVIARNSLGEKRVETQLNVQSRHDDYRGVLKNSPRRECSMNITYTTSTSYSFQHYITNNNSFIWTESRLPDSLILSILAIILICRIFNLFSLLTLFI